MFNIIIKENKKYFDNQLNTFMLFYLVSQNSKILHWLDCQKCKMEESSNKDNDESTTISITMMYSSSTVFHVYLDKLSLYNIIDIQNW